MNTETDPYWRVLLRGENFWTNLEGSIQRLGFHTTRFVQASERDLAEHHAVELIKGDTEFPATLNDEHDLPMVYAEEVDRVDTADFASAGSGYSFYNDKSLPLFLEQHPTGDAIKSLAERFQLPHDEDMQDWEFEVSDPDRVGEFLAAFEAGELTDDEKLVLMNTIIDSIEDGQHPVEKNAGWKLALHFIEKDIDIHLSTVAYWSCLDTDDLTLTWGVTPFMREIYDRHRSLWEIPPHRAR